MRVCEKEAGLLEELGSPVLSDLRIGLHRMQLKTFYPLYTGRQTVQKSLAKEILLSRLCMLVQEMAFVR
mgnify:CR=1 FL=1